MFMRRLREISDRRSGMGTTLKGVLRTTELEVQSWKLRAPRWFVRYRQNSLVRYGFWRKVYRKTNGIVISRVTYR
jgi:hypothetical protein